MLKTVHDCGMPFFESPYRFGNLYINFNILFPKSIDEEQSKGLQLLFASGQMELEEDPSIKEKCSLSDYNESEENTYETGGKRPRKSSGDKDDDRRQGGVRCDNQ